MICMKAARWETPVNCPAMQAREFVKLRAPPPALTAAGGDELRAEMYEERNHQVLTNTRRALKKAQSRDDFAKEFHNREAAVTALKRTMAQVRFSLSR